MNKPRQYPRDYVTGSEDLYNAALPFTVYILYCPVQKRICYVGQTHAHLYYRLSMHQMEATAFQCSAKQRWLRELRALGTMPLIRAVGRLETREQAKAFEAILIKALYGRRQLFNIEGTPIDTRLAINRQARATARFMGAQQ